MSSTRDRIIAEATHQLTRVGYAAFTVAAVRDALGLSSGSMFHAFPSKPALAAAVYVDAMADYQRAATRAILASEAPADALRQWIAVHLGWVEDHRELARYLFSTLPDEVMDQAAAPLAAHNEAFFAACAGLFARAATAGLMARMPRAAAHAIALGPAQEYCRYWLRGQADKSPRQLVRTLQRAALAGLTATLHTRSRKEISL